MHGLTDCGHGGEQDYGNIRVRPVRLARVGDQVGGHTHRFDHLSVVMKGRVQLLVENPEHGRCTYDLGPLSRVLVRAQAKHTITALEDDTELWCIFAQRSPDGVVADGPTGWLGASL